MPYRSQMVANRRPQGRKVAVDEAAAMGTSQKHEIPLVKRSDASAQGLPSFLGGGQSLSITPVMIQDDHGVFPGLQIVSVDGWVCILDTFAIDDLVSVFSKFKPQLEGVYQDLNTQGLIL